MLYFNFKNYEEFKTLFGNRVGNNGKNIRSNGILLSFYKHEFKHRRFASLQVFQSVDDIYNYFINRLGDGEYRLANDISFEHTDYIIDHLRGVCEDGDSRCIRYTKADGRVYKMKAGKLMRKLLEYHGFAYMCCEQAVIYICERFAEEWRSFVESKYGFKYTLHVDDKFYKIYGSYYCVGNFNSCMANNEQYSFYENAVDASAAYLTNEDDKIVARCVIFNSVMNEDTGEMFCLAERQYSTDQDNVLKQILIDKLIEGGYIDGYKRVGVDCHNARGFVLNDGTPMNDMRLSIECNLDYEDTISYQDSFKWYDIDYKRADNYGGGDIDLATTESRLGGDNYDEYHDRYCRSVITVYVYDYRVGRYYESTCDEDDLDDFEYCDEECDYYDNTLWSSYESQYIPCECAVRFEYNEDWIHANEAVYCEEMDDYLPRAECNYFFDKWKEENWEYDEINKEYVKETIEVNVWSPSDISYVYKDTSLEYAETNMYYYEGEWYDDVNKDGIPYLLAEEFEEELV